MSSANPKAAPRVLFLPDCGPEVGGGHLMRCLALAEALAARGADCAMLEAPAATGVLDAFAGRQLERVGIPAAAPEPLAEAAVAAAGAWRADLVVVDHYGLETSHEQRLARTARPVAVIDDLADRTHACAVLVDPGLGRVASDYALLVPAGAKVLTGPDYALLRPVFAAARAVPPAPRRPEAPPRRVLISLGLTDVHGITGRVLELLRERLGPVEADVVVGGAAQSLPQLRRIAAEDPRIRLHVDTVDMAALIAAADIGVGAGGSSTWERAALGLPSISLVLADNQREVALELDRRGAVLAIDARGEAFAGQLADGFDRLLAEGALRQRLSEVSAALCDGEGALRVAEALLALV